MKIDHFYGTPQSVTSDHFHWRDGATGPMGHKLEMPPMFPGISAGVFNGVGQSLQSEMAALPHTNAMWPYCTIASSPTVPTVRVRIADDGSPVLDHEVSDYIRDGIRHADLSIAEAQFAAGAHRVRPAHSMARIARVGRRRATPSATWL